MVVDESLGGAGADWGALASVISEIGGACASTALVAISHIIAEKAIELTATETIRNVWLKRLIDDQALGAFTVHEANSGGNAGAISTTARKNGDHYIINGSKFFITSAGVFSGLPEYQLASPERRLTGPCAIPKNVQLLTNP